MAKLAVFPVLKWILLQIYGFIHLYLSVLFLDRYIPFGVTGRMQEPMPAAYEQRQGTERYPSGSQPKMFIFMNYYIYTILLKKILFSMLLGVQQLFTQICLNIEVGIKIWRNIAVRLVVLLPDASISYDSDNNAHIVNIEVFVVQQFQYFKTEECSISSTASMQAAVNKSAFQGTETHSSQLKQLK